MVTLPSQIEIVGNEIITTRSRMSYLYCVYGHYVQTPDGLVLVYVGVCKLTEVYQCPDARRNNAWNTMVTDAMELHIRIIGVSPASNVCHNHRANLVREHGPYCNVHGHKVGDFTSIITCNETGTSYANASKCAIAEGISTSALSNHLNNKSGWKTVKGKTYRRGI